MKTSKLLQKSRVHELGKKLIGTRLFPSASEKRKHAAFQKLNRKRRESTAILATPFFQTYSPYGIPWMMDRCCAISKELSFAYCRIPKAANSTVIATLYNEEYSQSSFSRDEMNRIKMTKYIKPSQISDSELQLFLSTAFIFTVSRNPYTRLISAYKDKIEDISETQHRYEALDFLEKSEDSIIGFEEFLDFLEFGNGLTVNYHWARQIDTLAVPVEKIS
ncbi:MAG: sulfotransferase family 2 domain-containing protein, partial [Phormidesmis sp.]